MSEITIRLPDGSERALSDGATAGELAASIGPGLAKAALIAIADDRAIDPAEALPNGAQIRFITDRDAEALEHLRHSTAHVLAQAVLELWPGATFAGGPPIEDGFYYDFELPAGATFSDTDLERIDARMREIIAADQPFERFELPLAEAIELMADHPYKRAFMDLAATGEETDGDVVSGEAISFYRNTDAFVDMCRGPHVPSTGRLGHFKLMRVAGAYFRGSEKNPMLQRIYGTAWANKKELAAHLHRLEEAVKRDHRKLGTELDLFSFPDEIGSGLAVFHPKGGIVRRVMEDYSRKRHEQGGYEFVYSPHITKSHLFETSGHLEWFADGMFPPMERRRAHRLLPEADELPVPHPDLSIADAELSRVARAHVRVRVGVPLREVRRGPRAHPGARHDPGRRAHLHDERPDGRGARLDPGLRAGSAVRLRPRRLLPGAFDAAAGEVGGQR